MLRLGAGAHLRLNEKIHAVGEVAWFYSDVSSDLAGFADGDSGYELKAGALDGDRLGSRRRARRQPDLGRPGEPSRERRRSVRLGSRPAHPPVRCSAGAMYTMLEDDDQIWVSARVAF